jgi:UDP-N-acetylglucosamine transferase subunit ALG13
MDRILIEIDTLINTKKIEEEVFAQTGYCQYKPSYFKSRNFLDREEFDQYIKNCDLLITHAGSASIMAGLKCHKPVIAIPRLKAYGEHVDDHQKELAGLLYDKGYLIMTENMSMLEEAILLARTSDFKVYESSTSKIVNIIRDYIEQI